MSIPDQGLGEQPNYKHFKKKEDCQHQPVEESHCAAGQMSEGFASPDEELVDGRAEDQASINNDDACNSGAQVDGGSDAMVGNKEKGFSDMPNDADEPNSPDATGVTEGSMGLKERIKSVARLIGIVALFWVVLTIVMFVITAVGNEVDYGGQLMRFGIGGLATTGTLAPVAVIGAIVLAGLVVAGKVNAYKLTIKSGVVIGASSFGIILLLAAGMAGTDITCMHIDTSPATCTEPETCTECGYEIGDPLGHDYAPATCTQPETCRRCGETTGKAKGHTAGEWTVVQQATCSAMGSEVTACIDCGEELTRAVVKLPHTPGEMMTVQEPSVSYASGRRVDTPGKREQKCTVCGAVISSEEIQPSEEQATAAFKAACVDFSYDQAARNPDSLDGSFAKFSGRVVQVMQEGNIYILRVNKDNNYNRTVYVMYVANAGAPRILEDDNITVWGTLNGLETYTTIFGASVTIPSFMALYIE